MPVKTEEFIIIKRTGSKVEYLRHEGFQHFWTTKKDEAMVYTILATASALCDKMQGTEVVTAQGATAHIRPLV